MKIIMKKSVVYNRFLSANRLPDNFDVIKAYYIDGKKLSAKQEEKRLQYEQAHNLRLAGYSKDQVIKILLQKKVISNNAMGFRVVNGAEILFGDVAASNREGMRVILTENFLLIYQL